MPLYEALSQIFLSICEIKICQKVQLIDLIIPFPLISYSSKSDEYLLHCETRNVLAKCVRLLDSRSESQYVCMRSSTYSTALTLSQVTWIPV